MLYYNTVLPVYCLEHDLHGKRYTILLESQFKLLRLIEYSPWVLKDLNVSVVTRCWHISQLLFAWSTTASLFFPRKTALALTRLSFKILAPQDPITGTFLKNFSCSLSGVYWKHWIICYIKSTFYSSCIFVCLKLRTSKVFLALKFVLLKNCYCIFILSAITLIYYSIYEKMFSDQILLKLSSAIIQTSMNLLQLFKLAWIYCIYLVLHIN